MVVGEGMAGVLVGESGVRLGVLVTERAHCGVDTETFSDTGWQPTKKTIVSRRMLAQIKGMVSGFLFLIID